MGEKTEKKQFFPREDSEELTSIRDSLLATFTHPGEKFVVGRNGVAHIWRNIDQTPDGETAQYFVTDRNNDDLGGSYLSDHVYEVNGEIIKDGYNQDRTLSHDYAIWKAKDDVWAQHRLYEMEKEDGVKITDFPLSDRKLAQLERKFSDQTAAPEQLELNISVQNAQSETPTNSAIDAAFEAAFAAETEEKPMSDEAQLRVYEDELGMTSEEISASFDEIDAARDVVIEDMPEEMAAELDAIFGTNVDDEDFELEPIPSESQPDPVPLEYTTHVEVDEPTVPEKSFLEIMRDKSDELFVEKHEVRSPLHERILQNPLTVALAMELQMLQDRSERLQAELAKYEQQEQALLDENDELVKRVYRREYSKVDKTDVDAWLSFLDNLHYLDDVRSHLVTLLDYNTQWIDAVKSDYRIAQTNMSEPIFALNHAIDLVMTDTDLAEKIAFDKQYHLENHHSTDELRDDIRAIDAIGFTQWYDGSVRNFEPRLDSYIVETAKEALAKHESRRTMINNRRKEREQSEQELVVEDEPIEEVSELTDDEYQAKFDELIAECDDELAKLESNDDDASGAPEAPAELAIGIDDDEIFG